MSRRGTWDAAAYDRLADPQEAWAREIAQRLPARVSRLLDAGCGTGRATRVLLDRAEHVVAVDRDEAMVARARENLGSAVEVRRQDLLELSLDEPVDAIFSCAVFHHVPDHEALFDRLHAALRPGGRLVAQCGGAGNIARFHAVLRRVAARWGLEGIERPWTFPGPEETERRLASAGFRDVRCWLEERPVTIADAEGYVGAVCLTYHLPQLSEADRGDFTREVLAEAGRPLTLDYVRLNIDATA